MLLSFLKAKVEKAVNCSDSVAGGWFSGTVSSQLTNPVWGTISMS